MKNLLIALALAGTALPAYACHPRPDPMYGVMGPDDLKFYQRIFVGEVVAVRLTEHIAQLQRDDQHLESLTIMGGTLPFEFEVYPSEVMHGSVDKPQGLKAGGCAVTEPALHDRVVVFQGSDGWTRFHVLQGATVSGVATDADHYVAGLRACLAGACNSTNSP